MIFRFEDITAFSAALGDAAGALALPEGETVTDGEWVLAIFEIGSRRRATAAAARGVRAAGDTHLAFERRDWDRLQQFVAARSEHMKAARPLSQASVPPVPLAGSLAPGSGSGSASSGRLPVAASIPPASITYSDDPPPSSALESSRVPFGSRVLLVDEDEGSRTEVRKMLAEVGLVVDAVGNATHALTRMREVEFDAIVLDFQMRGDDPLALVRDLRKDPRSTPLPVLFLSSQPSSRDVVDAFASGADDFLAKPFRAPELGARVFGLLRRARLARMSLSGPPSARPTRTSDGGDGGSLP